MCKNVKKAINVLLPVSSDQITKNSSLLEEIKERKKNKSTKKKKQAPRERTVPKFQRLIKIT